MYIHIALFLASIVVAWVLICLDKERTKPKEVDFKLEVGATKHQIIASAISINGLTVPAYTCRNCSKLMTVTIRNSDIIHQCTTCNDGEL